MKALIAFVVIALVAVAGYKYFGIGSVSAPALAPSVSTSESAPKAAESMEDGTLTDEQSQALEAKEKAENQKTLKTPAPTVVPATSKGTYEPYDAAKLALAKTEKVILFFHADWCPICRGIDKEIASQGLPGGVHILKVDFDTATDLKVKYGVRQQYTFVEVSADGKQIKQWPALSLKDVLSGIK